MKNIFFNFCEKFISGTYILHIGKIYTNIPKIFPIFLVAFILGTIGQLKKIPMLEYFFLGLFIIALFGFFYYNIFPSRLKDNKLKNKLKKD